MESRNFEVSEKPATLVGSLVKTEYISVGFFQRCEIQKVISTDLITGKVIKLIKLELTINGNYGTEIKSAALDFNEVEGLINSLIAFDEKVITTTPAVYTEVNYTTNDFKAGCYYSEGSWTVFLKLSPHDNDSYIIVPNSNIRQLVRLLENTKL